MDPNHGWQGCGPPDRGRTNQKSALTDRHRTDRANGMEILDGGYIHMRQRYGIQVNEATTGAIVKERSKR
ncbi:hypothetical protein LTR28_011324 [Elasticomyces elasticus]|nr:hypothetical protein LTR28_011324 [Elasticomyces elasticus]